MQNINKVAKSNKERRTEFLFDYHFGFLFLNLLFMVRTKKNHACMDGEKTSHYLESSFVIVFKKATQKKFDNKIITKSMSKVESRGVICRTKKFKGLL